MSPPQTPKPKRVLALQTPKALRKRTLLDIDDSYVEEDDATYVFSERSDVDDDSGLDDDILDLDGDDEVLTVTESTPISENTSKENLGTKEKPFLLRHEIPRKIFHSAHGLTTLYLYTRGCNTHQIFWPLFALTSVLLVLDLVRFRVPAVNKFLVRFALSMIRDKEVDLWNGTVFYAGGLALVFAVAPKDICVMSALLLSWADTAASTFGRRFGKYTPQIMPGKSLAGSLAAGVAGVLATYLFYGYFVPNFDVNVPGDIFWTPETSRLTLGAYALVAGLAASVSEAINIADIDDNFTIPVLSSGFLYAAVWATRINY